MSNKVKKTGTKRKLNVTWAALLWTDWGNICYTPVNSDRRRRTLHPQAEPGLHALATTLVLATTNPPSNKKKRVCAYGSVLFGLSCWRPGTGFVNVRFPPNFYHFIRSFIRSGQNHRARHSKRVKKDTVDRGRGGKTTSRYGQAWSSPSPRGQWRRGKNGGNWLRNHLWRPNGPRG